MYDNIALIGMSGCGKTVVGQRTAELFGMQFFDVDVEIEREQNMEISEIFSQFGESKFRELESAKINELAMLDNVTIATGGGAVLNPENMAALKQKSLIVFLDRSLSDILSTLDISNRPLLTEPEQVYALYDERIELYRKYADLIVENDDKIDQAAMSIIKKIAFPRA